MSEKILVPALGESVTEATVAKWLKSQGEKVSSDEPVVELETDKVNIEVPAPSNGILSNISVKEGETVNVGSLLGTISENKISEKKSENKDKKYSPPIKKVSKTETNKPAKSTSTIEPLVLSEQEQISDEKEKPFLLKDPG